MYDEGRQCKYARKCIIPVGIYPEMRNVLEFLAFYHEHIGSCLRDLSVRISLLYLYFIWYYYININFNNRQYLTDPDI